MSYSDGLDVTYSVTHDFGAGALAYEIDCNGRSGVIKRVELANVTETFTNTTTEGRVEVGHSGDTDKQVVVGTGTIAAGSAKAWDEQDAGFTGVPVDPADGDLLITGVAPTGGTPAGIADVVVTVRWFGS